MDIAGSQRDAKWHKVAGNSILALTAFLFISNIIGSIIHGGLNIDLTIILLFWVGLAVQEFNVSAYKWGVFFMGIYSIHCLVSLILGITHSPYFEINDWPASKFQLLIYLPLLLILMIWCSFNFMMLLKIMRQEGVRFWSKRVTVAIGLFLGIPLIILGVVYFSKPDYARKKFIEAEFAGQIAAFKEAVRNDQLYFPINEDLLAVFDKRPEIIEASIQIDSMRNGFPVVQSQLDLYQTTNMPGIDIKKTVDENGNQINVLFYEDFTKVKDDEWVKIKMTIKDVWGENRNGTGNFGGIEQ